MDRLKQRLLKTVPKKASYTVGSISVFGRFSVDDRRKGIKKYAFFNENALISVDRRNQTKTLMWSKMFWFVLVETKTDTFKNALFTGFSLCNTRLLNIA